MTTVTTVAAVSNGETRPMWQLLFGIVDRPAATLGAVLARRKWYVAVVPLLIVFVCLALLVAARAPHDAELARQQAQRQLDSMPAEQARAAQASGAMDTFTSAPFILGAGLVTGLFALVIGVVAQAAVLYFGALITGGEVNFGQVFTMSAWTRLPSAVGDLVQAGFTLAAGRAIQYPGLSTLVATGDLMKDARNPMFGLLSGIDLFWLWHLLLVAVGLSVVARFGRVKATTLTLVYAALSLALVVLPTLLFGGMSGS
jgi:hypothetical protein